MCAYILQIIVFVLCKALVYQFQFEWQTDDFECALWMWNNETCFHINAPWWLKRRLERKSCSASAWALRKVCVWELRWAVGKWGSHFNVRPEQLERDGERVGGGKGLVRDGRMNAGEEINTRETRRKKSGSTPQYTWRIWVSQCLLAIKWHTSVFNSYYKGLGGNITHGWSQVFGWNESSQMHCKKVTVNWKFQFFTT